MTNFRRNKQDYSKRQQVIVWIMLSVVLLYLLRLFGLQIVDDHYKTSADRNAILKNLVYPTRGLMYDRNEHLIVSNQAAYDVMLIMREMTDFDTLSFCQTLNLSQQDFDERIAYLKNRRKNPSYSSYTPQVFMAQISGEEYGHLQEKMFRYSGLFVRKRVLREYPYRSGAHVLGSVGEVSRGQMRKDEYYKTGDYRGQSGLEKQYETELRGEKGQEFLLRDVRGRIKGPYLDGDRDVLPQAGKDLELSLDIALQDYGEQLMYKKRGCIVAIEPATGEILAMVSSPHFDPSLLVGRQRSKNYRKLAKDPTKPLFNRSVMAQYPPGSTFKIPMALLMQQENIINNDTRYACHLGYYYTRTRKVGCHAHKSPLNLPESIQHSCNAYYCNCFKELLDNNKDKYGSVAGAFDVWHDYLTSMGLGKKMGIDFPVEKKGFIPNSSFFNRYYGKKRWKSSTVISLSIGQGEIMATPVQIANLAALVANKGHYYTPHLVRKIDGVAVAQDEDDSHDVGIKAVYFDPVIEGMRLAVEEGTARSGRMDSIPFCGKTGTAQNPHGDDHSIFMAFAPIKEPKIAIVVYVENGGFGSKWAVPIASLMIEKYLHRVIDEKRKPLEQHLLENGLEE